MEYLSLGAIIGSVGLKGEMKVYSTTNNQILRYKPGNKLLLCQKDITKEVTVQTFRKQGNFDIVSFNEIQANEIDQYKGFCICVKKNISDLNPGYYFYSDLVGMKIIDEKNIEYGVVKKVEEFPAQITLRVQGKNNKDFFIPFIKEFIIKIDLPSKSITVNIWEGMI